MLAPSRRTWSRTPSAGGLLIAAGCAAIACAAASACSASSTDGPSPKGNAGAGGQAGFSDGGAGAGGSGGAPAFDAGDVNPGDGGPKLVAEVFGHSSSQLYRLDPDTKAVTVVGSFDGCSSVIDIALDKDSKMYGTTFTGLYAIDKATAKCASISSGSYPNSLSFVPAGTVDPAQEALVGYLGSTYVRIDTASGKVSNVGGLGGGYTSSGDIVSVKDGGTYLTVKGVSCDDCLVEVNPKTGDLLKNWGPVGHTDVFGLAFWAGKAYGFTNGGVLFEIEFAGASVKATPIPIPGGGSGLSFWGAGSTTSAPPKPIPR